MNIINPIYENIYFLPPGGASKFSEVFRVIKMITKWSPNGYLHNTYQLMKFTFATIEKLNNYFSDEEEEEMINR